VRAYGKGLPYGALPVLDHAMTAAPFESRLNRIGTGFDIVTDGERFEKWATRGCASIRWVASALAPCSGWLIGTGHIWYVLGVPFIPLVLIGELAYTFRRDMLTTYVLVFFVGMVIVGMLVLLACMVRDRRRTPPARSSTG
jgi:hypothetical protein